MLQTFIIFGAAFWLVFFLGLQSLLVNNGHAAAAMFNALIIGVFNLTLFRTVPNITDPVLIAAYLSGGPAGIWCSMAFHRRVVLVLRERWSR